MTSPRPLEMRAVLDALPPPWPQPLLPEIARHVEAAGRRYAVLDDDPTGGQALHGLPVLANSEVDALNAEVEACAAFFILTNTRAMPESEAVATTRRIGSNLRDVERRTGRQIIVGSRGDSTLRGHFPAETDALYEGLTGDASCRPRYVFAPYFAEGGRFTLDDTQYLLQGPTLVPVAETEFARDPRFAYGASHLPSWLEERSGGKIRAADVVGLSIGDIRLGGPSAVASKLAGVPEGGVALMNALCDRDLEVFVAGLLEAEASGCRFLYRTAASFVRVRAGIEPRPLLTSTDLNMTGAPGLIVAGSYVERTTEQLSRLLAIEGVEGIELPVRHVLGTGSTAAIEDAARSVSSTLARGCEAILYTSRALAETPGAESAESGGRIAQALCDVVLRVEVRPGYLLVKGGSTAHAIATRALAMHRAVVLGQLRPGVPVWRLGPESRFPDLPYVIFPGNVGGPDDLVEAVHALRGSSDASLR